MSRSRLFTVVAALCLIIAFAVLVVSCFGDGDDGWKLAPPPDQSPSGIYQGPFTSTTAGPRQVTGVISEDFDAQFLVQALPLHYAGTVAVDGDVLTGTLTEYRGSRGRFLGFDGVSSIELDGTVTEADGMFGDYAGADDQGRFNLNYLDLYERNSSLDLTSGIWTFNLASAGGGVYTVTLEINVNGQLFGSDTAGCVFSGQMATIDGRYNAYRAAASISSCGEADGDYTGLAYLFAFTLENDALFFSISNANVVFSTLFQKI